MQPGVDTGGQRGISTEGIPEVWREAGGEDNLRRETEAELGKTVCPEPPTERCLGRAVSQLIPSWGYQHFLLTDFDVHLDQWFSH